MQNKLLYTMLGQFTAKTWGEESYQNLDQFLYDHRQHGVAHCSTCNIKLLYYGGCSKASWKNGIGSRWDIIGSEQLLKTDIDDVKPFIAKFTLPETGLKVSGSAQEIYEEFERHNKQNVTYSELVIHWMINGTDQYSCLDLNQLHSIRRIKELWIFLHYVRSTTTTTMLVNITENSFKNFTFYRWGHVSVAMFTFPATFSPYCNTNWRRFTGEALNHARRNQTIHRLCIAWILLGIVRIITLQSMKTHATAHGTTIWHAVSQSEF